MSKLPRVTAGTFDSKVLESELPVLVDFTASWCGPCRAAAPILERLAQVYKDRAHVYALDVDADEAVAARYRIRGMPSFLLFKGGRCTRRFEEGFGSGTRAQLDVALAKACGGK